MSAERDRYRRWLLPLLLVLAAAVRLYALDREPLWLDEAVTVHYAGRQLFDIPAADPHPHLYYALLHFWLALGDQEWVVRGLSAIFGTVTVGLSYALGRVLGGVRLAYLVAVLAAFSPFLVRYSQEVRMYGLLAALATVALLGLVRLSTDPRSMSGWTIFVLGTGLMLHTHAISVVFLALANLFLALVLLPPPRQPGSLRRWAWAVGAMALLWAPALPRLLRPSSRSHLSIPPLDWQHLMATARQVYVPGLADPAALVGAASLVALAIVGLHSWHQARLPGSFSLVFAVLPLPLVALVSLAWPVLLPRVLIWSVVPWIVLVARGALSLGSRARQAAGIAVLLAISTLGLLGYYRDDHKEAWDQVASHIGQQAEMGDLIVFVAGYVDVPFNYYFRHEAVVLDQYPVSPGGVESDHLADLDRAVGDRSRVWLVYSHAAAVDPTDSVLATMERSYTHHERSSFEGVDVYLMRSDSR